MKVAHKLLVCNKSTSEQLTPSKQTLWNHFETYRFTAGEPDTVPEFQYNWTSICELNQNSHIHKYSMKEIMECIGDIGRANSTSGFWQMQLDEDFQWLTAFTIPGKGQFHWITSPMGLLGCLASFRRLSDIPNLLVYILVHTDTLEKHLPILDNVLARLHKNNLKINLEKCNFGNKEVLH